MTRKVSAVEDPVPRRAPVIAPRAGDVQVDAVYPVRESALAKRSGCVEERLDCRFILCERMRPICGDPARKKTTDNVHVSLTARQCQRCGTLATTRMV